MTAPKALVARLVDDAINAPDGDAVARSAAPTPTTAPGKALALTDESYATATRSPTGLKKVHQWP